MIDNHITVSEPITYDKLSIYFISGKPCLPDNAYLLLQEAMSEGQLLVHETGKVENVCLENLSNTDVYIQAGDIIKGGRQDRIFSRDFIVPPASGKVLAKVFCSESGRWRLRDGEKSNYFDSSTDRITSKELKLATFSTRSQSTVWDQVERVQSSLSVSLERDVRSRVSTTSLQLSLEDDRVNQAADTYQQKLLTAIQIVSGQALGYAFTINGRINSADIYGSSSMFAGLWPRLLRASAIESVAAPNPGYKITQVSVDQIRHILLDQQEATFQKECLTHDIEVITRESETVFCQHTISRKYENACIHSFYLAK